MARIRTIKPEIASDAKLARVSRDTRYHFVLLWTACDDAGFFRAAPRQLLGQLYPHDRDLGEARVNEMTAELAEAGFVRIVQTDDGPIGYVVNWNKHQRIDRPSKSHLQECVAQPSRNPREGVATGVLSPDLGVLSLESSPPAPKSWKPELEQRVAEQLPSDAGRVALTAVLARAVNKTEVVAEISMVLQGGRANVSKKPEHVELALMDYAANEQRWNNQLFRRYVQTAAKAGDPPPPRPTRPNPGAQGYANALGGQS